MRGYIFVVTYGHFDSINIDILTIVFFENIQTFLKAFKSRGLIEVVIRIYLTFKYNLKIKHGITTCLKESCLLDFNKCLPFEIFDKI